ncbi:MAG TPA: sigma-70 family RNA polymerase sigma factor [Gemmataceae bacterium]|nr:sigma-70 family RNA polymerase sigma factor [Gemmataceae bacterium]
MNSLQPDSAQTQNLLERVHTGDREAFEELFARHRPYLKQLVELRLDPKLRTRIDPSDVVQEAHLEAFRRLNAYLQERPMPFRLWLRQIAYDHTLKAWRHHRGTARRAAGREVPLPERSSLVFAKQLLAGSSTPSQQLDRRELAQRLRQAMAQLPRADREVILMRHFEGLSNQEVGCLLGMDPGTVSKQHGRAMLRLHKILFEGGMTESQL